MALTTTSQIIMDGPRNVVWQFTGIGDGAGDETAALKVDLSQLQGPITKIKVRRIDYSISYGVVQLQWDMDNGVGAIPPVTFVAIEGYDHIDYRREGGIGYANVPNATGNILFSTLGFELNSTYTIKLSLTKFTDPIMSGTF